MKKDYRGILLLIVICIVAILSVLAYFSLNDDSKIPTTIYSIKVRGYELNNAYDTSIYDYNVEVEEDTVEISCNSTRDIKGCNETIDLTDKSDYVHKIKIFDGEKKVTYKIHIIKKEEKIDPVTTSKNIEINSITGNSFEWTNKDVILKVNVKDKNVNGYSFDNGITWQISNTYTITNNKKLQIIVKDSNNNKSQVKNIEVDKIDKEKPTGVINKKKITKNKITIEVVGSDNLSGIDTISFNGGEYKKNTTYDITKEGTYYVTIKDKAGNISDKITIQIFKSDFATTQQESKIYTATFVGNGASVDKNQLSCSTLSSSCPIILPKIVSGRTILGYSTDKNAKTAEYKAGAQIQLSNNMTLYAITSVTYTATFNANGASLNGSTTASCNVYNSQTSCAVSMPTISRNSGKVLGFSTNKSSKTVEYKVGAQVQLNGNATLYAITSATYTATFNANGATLKGNTTASCSVYNSQTSCTVSMPTISKSGGSVIGWNTNKNATVASANAQSTVSLNNNITLYAITGITYKVVYNANGATLKGNTTASCTAYNTNSSCGVSMPTISRTGGKAIGWNVSKDATTSKYPANPTLNLGTNITLYAITSATYTVIFDKNAANSIGATSLSCNVYNSQTSCDVKMPTITRKNWTVLGWSINNNAYLALYKVGAMYTVNENKNNITFYAVTKQTLTATFDSTGLDMIEYTSTSCDRYNKEPSCTIILPKYNKKGYFNAFWSSIALPSQNLFGVQRKSEYFNASSSLYSLNSNKTLYPNLNHYNYNYYNPNVNDNSRLYKFRSFTTQKTVTIGNTIFEYEKGIPEAKVNSHITFLNKIYQKNALQFLFKPGKVYIMTHSTYENYSIAYGVMHMSGAYFAVDLQYDKNGRIDEPATIHEMAHAWDYYCAYIKGLTMISNSAEFDVIYQKLYPYLSGYKEKNPLSKLETFAATVVNYYYHIINNNTEVAYYGIENHTYTYEEKNLIKNLINAYKDY